MRHRSSSRANFDLRFVSRLAAVCRSLFLRKGKKRATSQERRRSSSGEGQGAQDGRFAAKQIETPQTVFRVTEDGEPGWSKRVRCGTVPNGENATHDVLVEGNAEGQGDLLSDPRTTPSWIPPLHLDDRGDDVRGGPLRSRLSRHLGRRESPIFPLGQSSMKTEQGCGFEDDGGTDHPSRSHEQHTHAGDEAIREAEGHQALEARLRRLDDPLLFVPRAVADAFVAEQRYADPSPGHAAGRRRRRGDPGSRWPPSSLRTPRGLSIAPPARRTRAS